MAGISFIRQTGQIKCNQVVLCCSIYVDDLNKKLKYAAFPVYTFVMVTKPIPKESLDAALIQIMLFLMTVMRRIIIDACQIIEFYGADALV